LSCRNSFSLYRRGHVIALAHIIVVVTRDFSNRAWQQDATFPIRNRQLPHHLCSLAAATLSEGETTPSGGRKVGAAAVDVGGAWCACQDDLCDITALDCGDNTAGDKCLAYLIVRQQAFAFGVVVVQKSTRKGGIGEDFRGQEDCAGGLGGQT